jgi:integrase
MTSINRPLEEAIKLARAANLKFAELVVDDGSLLAVLTGDRLPIVNNLLQRFTDEWLPDKGYASRTLEEIKFKIERYRQDLGDRLIGQMDVLAMAEYLDQFSNNAYTKHRGLWVQIFVFAVAKGLAGRNNAELTLVKKEAEKKRQRHTLDGLKTIIDAATTPPWLKRAIRLALASLQRREDIVTWLKSAVDMDKNTLTVSPGKTQGYENPVHLKITMGAALREVVGECLRSPLVSPYLIHYKLKTRRREQIDAKDH